MNLNSKIKNKTTKIKGYFFNDNKLLKRKTIIMIINNQIFQYFIKRSPPLVIIEFLFRIYKSNIPK
jgi:hypothetical protein